MRSLPPQNTTEDVVYASVIFSLLACVVSSGVLWGIALGAWLAAAYIYHVRDLRDAD